MKASPEAAPSQSESVPADVERRRLQNNIISVSAPGIRLYQTVETRDLTTNQRSRPMDSIGGVTFEFNPSTGFSDSVSFMDDNVIVWDPNTINSQVDDVYLNDDDPTWPCIVQSKFNDDLTEVVTVINNYVTDASTGPELVNAMNGKRQELMNSNNYRVGSPILDTTGTHRVYTRTFNLDTDLDEGSRSRYSGYSWYISNSTGFYSKDVVFRYDDSNRANYRAFYFEDDMSKVAIEKKTLEMINGDQKEVTVTVAFETEHAEQLLQNLESGLANGGGQPPPAPTRLPTPPPTAPPAGNGGDNGDADFIALGCDDFGLSCSTSADCCSGRCFMNQCQKMAGQGASKQGLATDRGGTQAIRGGEGGRAKAGLVDLPVDFGGRRRRVRGVRGSSRA